MPKGREIATVLTMRQKAILEFIREFIRDEGYSPSLKEIGAYFELSSVATVHRHVQHLIEKGYARRVANSPRSVEPVELGEEGHRGPITAENRRLAKEVARLQRENGRLNRLLVANGRSA